MKIKKGDKVKVITGKSKGKIGAVVRSLPKKGKVLVEGVNIMKRHVKGTQGQVGRIVERPEPIDASNVVKVEK